MKMKILLPLAIVAAIAALVYGYSQMSQEKVADEKADQPIAAASRVRTGADGATVITLDAKTRQLIGLRTATLAAATLPPEIQAYGRVLDSAALVVFHNNVLAARAALRAAELEYDRLKKLSAQDNASASALETAEAEMKRAQSALATAKAQLVAASGKAVADEPPACFQSLANLQSALVRLDVPAGEISEKTPVAAQVLLPGMARPVVANFLGRAAATDPQVQGVGFLFLATNAPATLAPGLTLPGFLQLPGEPRHGVVVPDDAVVRADGRAWIYVQTGEADFTRREMSLDQPAAGGWFVTNGVVPGDEVVVTGAQTLLSEERKSEIQVED